MPVGETVYLWRLERKFTQEELARRAGISRPNLSAIERGRREVSLRILRAVAAALEINPGMLVDGTAPGPATRGLLSREALERVADAVVGGKAIHSEKEKRLVELLKPLMKNRVRLVHGHKTAGGAFSGKRLTDAAWLRLRSNYPAQVIQNLIQRISDRQCLAHIQHESPTD